MKKCGDKPFPTAVRWISRRGLPEYPAGIEDCDVATLEKWEASGFAMPPYRFKREHGVVTPEGEERPPNADEREKMHCFSLGHTAAFSRTTTNQLHWEFVPMCRSSAPPCLMGHRRGISASVS